MKRMLTMLAAGLLLSAGAAVAAKPQVILGPGAGAGSFRVSYHQTWNRTLSADTIYILTGWYFVDSTYRLTIQPGTLILGDKPSAGSLIIKRGAKILADGTKNAPIVFTSAQAVGNRAPGDWGGVIILGAAPTNQPTTTQIEGGFGTVADSWSGYGGADPHDNSGILRYVRIEFAGVAFAQDNEINGLTFGGVGDSTLVDYVQVTYANDDDLEFFGGTVGIKHVLTMYNVDDNFDSDFGFRGRIQFACAVRNKNIFDASASGQSNGFESDNMGTAVNYVTPVTNAHISNVTIIGPYTDTTAAYVSTLSSKWGHLALLRRSTALSIYNSILMANKLGLNVRDSLTERLAAIDSLQVRSTSIQNAVGSPLLADGSAHYPGFSVSTWFNTPAYHNNGGTSRRHPGELGLVNPFGTGASWDPRPTPSSEPATAGTSYAGLDPWFDQVSYRGAFDPSLPMDQQWTAGWTNLDPQNTNYVTAAPEVGEDGVASSFVLSQNYPNPFNPSTTIDVTVGALGTSSTPVSLVVYDMLGREVATLMSGSYPAGNYVLRFDGTSLASGMYVYRLTAGATVQARTMMLLK